MCIKMHSQMHGDEIIMSALLRIRDIGQDRMAALEQEAKARGISISAVVRMWIDAGIAKSKEDFDRAAWIASAKAGIDAEGRHLEQHGPTLARFRQILPKDSI
jgi:post-segregation antitoxin (ccd killing protein)